MKETDGMKAKELLAYYQEKLDEEARQAKKEGSPCPVCVNRCARHSAANMPPCTRRK